MTSGGNNFNYFAENQLTKFSARDAEISVVHSFQGYFSRTFQDLKLQFPGLFRTKAIFQDFPGPGILKKKPGLSMTFQEAWEPCIHYDHRETVGQRADCRSYIHNVLF